MAADLDRIDELLSEQEKAVRDAFRAFLSSMNSDTVTAAIQAQLERGDVAGALSIIESYIARLGNVIPAIAATVGAFTAAELATIVAESVPDVVMAISFDPSFPRAAEIVQLHRGEFITYFTEQQRQATTQAIARSFREGTHAISTARAFRDSIGLTPAQEQWVANYRTALTSRNRNALQRDLRDRRFDGRVQAAIDRNRPLTDKQIDTMVERYRKNALQMRAETIARTEGGRATSEARDESLAQMIDQTGIDPGRIEEMWNATRDKNTRDWHASMNGQKRAIGVPFVDGLGNLLRYPHDPKAPVNTTANCRCTKTFSIMPPS